MRMKEIAFPVLVLDDDCITCENLNIVSQAKSRLYAGDQCVEQCMMVMCSNVYNCVKIQKRLKKHADMERRDNDA